MPHIKKMQDQDIALQGKRVLIREDFNVPLKNGKIVDDQRIKAALPTIQLALEKKAKIMLLSHLGRPTEGQFDPAFSLAPIAIRLSELLQHPVKLAREWSEAATLKSGDILLFENIRFHTGETDNDETLAKTMANLCDVFVMDAFATAHRAQASTYGVAEFAPIACAGPLLCAELDALEKSLTHPATPLVAIVGGAKVSTKLTILQSLLKKVDQLIVGGGIANTFLAAIGKPIGRSLYEPNLINEAIAIMAEAAKLNVNMPLPVDVVVAQEISEQATAHTKPVDAVAKDEFILDIGPKTIAQYTTALANAGTIVWNGPVGVFEYSPFRHGTEAIARAIAVNSAYTLAGGGDTLTAIAQFGVTDNISYISTGGGAFLEYLEGKTLPAVKILEERASQ